MPPQGDRLDAKLKETFQPSQDSAAVAANEAGAGKVLEIVEKRLEMDLWLLEGKDRGGAHLPIMFYTNSHGGRSVVALERRKNIAVDKQKKAGSSWRAAKPQQVTCFELKQLALERLVLERAGGFRWSGVRRSCGRMAK